jgi:hypothetical protein
VFPLHSDPDRYYRTPGMTRALASLLTLLAYKEAGLTPWSIVASSAQRLVMRANFWAAKPRQLVERGYLADRLTSSR